MRECLLSLGCCVLLAGSAYADDARGITLVQFPNIGGAPLGAAPLAPQVQAPTMMDEKVVVPLPATIDDVAVGGGGRYLVLYLKKLRKLAVFDVNKSAVKYLSLTSDTVFFAASSEKLAIVLPEENAIERYDLANLTRELRVALPNEGPVRSAVMGASSAGPLMVIADQTNFFDLGTLQEMNVENFDHKWGTSRGERNAYQVRASADGTVFTGWYNGQSPSGLNVLQLNGNKIEPHYMHDSVGYVLPGQDGSRIYASHGMYTPELQALDPEKFRDVSCIPVFGGTYFLGITKGSQKGGLGRGGFGGGFGGGFDAALPLDVAVYSVVDRRLLLTIPRLEELKATNSNMSWARENMTLEKLIYFFPAANLLITIPDTKDGLVVRKFNLLEALEKAGLDYFFVSSTPVPTARKGQTYSYQIDVKSKRGGVTYSLDSGPPRSTLSGNGRLVWNVPKDYAMSEENIIVSIRDAAGQQMFHTFKVRVTP